MAVKNPYTPIEEGGWNTHQLAAHTRDVHALVYGMRAQRTATEDNPMFKSFDGDAYMAEHYDPKEPLGKMLDEFAASVESMAGLVKGLPAEGWARLSSHETNGGGLTLQTWVERALGHIEEHWESVRKAK